MIRSLRTVLAGVCAVAILAAAATPALALDDTHYKKAEKIADKGVEFLKAQQNDDGSFQKAPIPGITGLVVAGMLRQPDIGPDDPAVKKAIEYILSKQKETGGIYDQILPNYNTSLCLSALALADRSDPRIDEAIKKAQKFLIEIQWSEGDVAPDGTKITEDHPHFGGAGYLKYGRPDMSNTNMMINALYDSGLPCEHPAFTRAIEFIHRNQGTASNEMFGDKIVQDGGFIYSLSGKPADAVGKPHSEGPEVMVDGEPRLMTYGSITYAGFKSYLYAQLPKDDARVVDAYNWIRKHYTLERNVGLPEGREKQGLYYGYVVHARALHAWGEPVIELASGEKVDWANNFIKKAAEVQNEDGSWTNKADRWMEGDPVLVTAYMLNALGFAMNSPDVDSYSPSNFLYTTGELKKK